MDWTWYLFSFNGRINRAKMWLAVLVILCWMIFWARWPSLRLFGGAKSFSSD